MVMHRFEISLDAAQAYSTCNPVSGLQVQNVSVKGCRPQSFALRPRLLAEDAQ